MKKTVALIDKFISLANGEALPASSLRGDWIEQMLEDGVLMVTSHGSRKTLRAIDGRSFCEYLSNKCNIRDLEECRRLLLSDNVERAVQVAVTGDSKYREKRTFYGFLVNSYQPIPATVNGYSKTILPLEGTFDFIYDYWKFAIPEDVVVIGIENPENFRYVSAQKKLFGSVVPDGGKQLFVSRYPQEQSKDLICWLQSIPNRYIHFDDFDLAGVHIYLTSFYKYLGERASFLIPADYEYRIAHGSRERYNHQLEKYGKMQVTDPRLEELVACIHQYHRGYDQEGYIERI